MPIYNLSTKKLLMRLTKKVDVQDGLEKRFYQTDSSEITSEIKFNTSISLPMPTAATEAKYKDILISTLSYKQSLTSCVFDEDNNSCRQYKINDGSCGNFYEPSEILSKISNALLSKTDLVGYRLTSVTWCLHNVDDQWHVELMHHKPANDLPMVINLHVKLNQTQLSSVEFQKNLQNQMTISMAKATQQLSKSYHQLQSLTEINYASFGYYPHQYLAFPKSTNTVFGGYQSSEKLMVQQLKQLGLEKQELQEHLEELEDDSFLTYEKYQKTLEVIENIAIRDEKIKTHSMTLKKLTLSGDRSESKPKAMPFSSFFARSPINNASESEWPKLHRLGFR